MEEVAQLNKHQKTSGNKTPLDIEDCKKTTKP